MTVKESKELMYRYRDGLNKGNLAIMDQIFSPQVVVHYANNNLNHEQYKIAVADLMAAFPDIKYKFDHVVAEGDTVVLHYSTTGTHRGPYSGIPATGRQITNTGMGIYKLADGRVNEVWLMTDNLGMLQQLGMKQMALP